ncbi:MAG: hypothetical protein ACLP50_35350, partial [Solirubrobacteraceae bacterium]
FSKRSGAISATSAFHVGRPPRNRGLRYPADPPPVEEIVAVIHAAGPDVYGDRLRAIVVVLWRAGLRVGEALALAETDLDPARGAVLVRRGKGGICRNRHTPPYVATRTMLRMGSGARRASGRCVLNAPPKGGR